MNALAAVQPIPEPEWPPAHLRVGAPISDSVGRTADAYREVRDLRLEMQRQTDVIKARENELKESIISRLSKSEDTGAAGLKYRAQIIVKRIPKISDWGVFTSWVRKHDRFDMLQKRLAETAVGDWAAENGDRIPPGLEAINVPDVSITKI